MAARKKKITHSLLVSGQNQEIFASACKAGDPGSIPESEWSPGEGNGNPLQYSCLENSMDREAWWATVHGFAKNGTQWTTNTQSPWLLYLLTSATLFYKRNWHPNPGKTVLCGSSSPSSPPGGFPNKITIPCPHTLSFRWFSCWEASSMSLGLVSGNKEFKNDGFIH